MGGHSTHYILERTVSGESCPHLSLKLTILVTSKSTLLHFYLRKDQSRNLKGTNIIYTM